MACRLPGADGLAQFWDLLKSGGYAIERMPDKRMDRELYFDTRRGQRGTTYSDIGGFVQERALDWNLLPLSQADAAEWDQCHLNLCEVAAQAIAHAGMDAKHLRDQRVGVFVGHSGGTTLGGDLALHELAEDYAKLASDPQGIDATLESEVQQELASCLAESRPARKEGKPRVEASQAAGLISRAFGFDGPFLSVDAACASSLVALSLAANSLHAGQSDMAIVGGASYNKTDSLILFSHAQSCSSTGSKPFDSEADGLISSEGYVCVVIKTLEQAVADGDYVQAVIRSIGISSDGRGRSLWAPRKEGQYTAIERAYCRGTDPADVQMIEAHATSTQVGDATEVSALASFFSEHLTDNRKLPIGSVKSNIGHTLETAGLAGLVKSVLSIQHAVIPPTANLNELNETIPWNDIPLYAARHAEPWPSLPANKPRRAAVNAFGIGGLNVHLVIDQFLESEKRPDAISLLPSVVEKPDNTSVTHADDSVAIIGRGLVLPGARSVEGFRAILQAGQSQLRQGVRQLHNQIGDAGYHCGFIDGFQYDWRKHKVPPKQIQQANPLQFMLLDAAEQALEEAGLLSRDWDRTRAAVVVGSSFGGDFGNQLFVGLRLPEIKSHLRRILKSRDATEDVIEVWVAEYEKRFLDACPAILDETGSFTSSTLASRLSKTYDMMGGAMAIDADDGSGLAALQVACGLLHSGAVSTVLCAAAQRALDRSALENLVQQRRLAFGKDGNGYAVGEGVALLVLQRTRDARRDGHQIVATIDSVVSGYDRDSLQSGFERARASLHECAPSQVHCSTNDDPGAQTSSSVCIGAVGIENMDRAVQAGLGAHLRLERSRNLDVTGHLQAAQGIADVIALSLGNDDSRDGDQDTVRAVAGHSAHGQCFLAAVHRGDRAMKQEPVEQAGSEIRLFRHAAADKQSLVAQLTGAGEARADAPTLSVACPPVWRAVVVSDSHSKQRLSNMLAGQIGHPASRLPLAEQGLFWSEPMDGKAKKVAWVFPGQGSQYPHMLQDLVSKNAVAAEALAEANAHLRAMGQPEFQAMAWQRSQELGTDVWRTQASMLVSDWIMLSVLRDRGLMPDVVCGHSFGEFPALLAAGCLSLEAALQATWARCQSIINNVSGIYTMLSVQAPADQVLNAIVEGGLALEVSHRNAPQQSVVGGQKDLIQRLVEQLDRQGITSRLLPVPTAFHTSSLQPAVGSFGQALTDVSIEPPKIPFLSNVCNRYVADPDAIRENLVQQLVQPLDFIGLVERLVKDGVGLAVEVGPQQVLTRLIRQNSDRLICVASDQPKKPAEFQLGCVQAQYELARDQFEQAHHHQDTTRDERLTVGDLAPRRSRELHTPKHFDATQVRKQRQRAQSSSMMPIPQSPGSAVHFDATARRRDLNRRLTGSEAERPVTPSPAPENPAPPKHENAAAETRQIEAFLVDFVVEQTGYPAEIVELDWDMEADLGIDSIKKAQLFGELREFFDLESHGAIRLDEFRTLRDIANLLAETPGKGEWLQADTVNADIPEPMAFKDELTEEYQGVKQTDESAARAEVKPVKTQQQKSSDFISDSQLTALLVDFVVEQTGYPPEIVELDADLEADLGIDSIKKAQLLGEIREMFDISWVTDNSDAKPRELRTLGDIKSAVTSLLTDRGERPMHHQNDVEPGPRDHIGDTVLSSRNQQQSMDARSDSGIARQVAVTDGESGARGPSMRDGGLLGQFPILSRTSTGMQEPDNQRFLKAAQRNLGYWVARPASDDDFTAVQLNGHAGEYERECQQSARLLGTSQQTVQGFDQCVLQQVCWQPLLGVDLPVVIRRSSTGPYLSLARLQIPSWLQDAETRLCPQLVASELQPDVYQLSLAGGVSPLVLVRQQRFVVLAGMQSQKTDPAKQFEFARKLRDLQPQEMPCVREFLRDGAGADSTWLIVADVVEKQVTFAEARNRDIDIVRTRLEHVEAPVESADGLTLCLNLKSSSLQFGTPRVASSHSESPVTGSRPLNPEQPAAAPSRLGPIEDDETESSIGAGEGITSRYVLNMVPSPARVSSAAASRPTWSGAAVVIGDNPVARHLEARLRACGVECQRWTGGDDHSQLAARFDEYASGRDVAHLFIASALDAEAQTTLDETAWCSRRSSGLMSVYWLCQRWLSHIISRGLAQDASLVGLTSLGGDFGLRGNVHSVEGGGLCGLLKAMLIESWTQGYRPLTIKLLDSSDKDSPSEIVNHVWQELAYQSYDMELAYRQGVRHVVRAFKRPLEHGSDTAAKRPTAGAWICTGGARGITAFVAEKLAFRYGLQLHLLGKAPASDIDPKWRDLDAAGQKQLKASVMTLAREQGDSPVQAWQDVEKAIEIDSNLRRMKDAGIQVAYHSCDVADREHLKNVLQQIRTHSAPITGVLHGAGVGKDSRFDRKIPEKVDQCIAAKIDGAFSLMDATRDDPLEYFLSFGSISGRFGANGHTDYSLANDMLCKQMDWYRQIRPDVRAVGFHWHAWGDIGMATKPETKLALEMINMQFMPAAEGLKHLIGEIECDQSDSEVLITDDRYFRTFYPSETLTQTDHSESKVRTPLLESEIEPTQGGTRAFCVPVDPIRDPFLSDHLLDDRPLLPIVVAAEMLREAAEASLDTTCVEIHNLRAENAIRFFTDGGRDLRVETSVNNNRCRVQLFSDFVSRGGHVLEKDRLSFRADVVAGQGEPSICTRVDFAVANEWQEAQYPPVDSKFYVGWPLQRLRDYQIRGDELVGRISAPALIELAGVRRVVRGWRVPSAGLDACLFATGILAWQRVSAGAALPVGIGHLSLGRLPDPGEACEVHVRFKSKTDRTAVFDFGLWGVDRTPILAVSDYEVAWLEDSLRPTQEGTQGTASGPR